MESRRVLVIGASGYVGSRLVPVLVKKGHTVVAAGRRTESLNRRPWAGHGKVELKAADVMDPDSLSDAFDGCDAVFYLVHSMSPGNKDFAETDRRAAENVREQARRSGVKQIIYLGGLGDDRPELSKHLKSRHEVSEILHAGDVPVTTFRAAMIMGIGSASFEILSYLVRRLPVMVTPRWVHTLSQPIAVSNMLRYLSESVFRAEVMGEKFDVGAEDRVTYRALMKMFEQEAGFRRRFVVPVPVLTPRLSSYWVHLVTPVSSSLARPLIEGLRNETVCQDVRIRDIIPQKLMTCREAVRKIVDMKDKTVTDFDEIARSPEAKVAGDPAWAGGALR